ncbi:MAG TPA: hypothetical protein VG897_00770 [Terriglobales bacterium]|nr:hypothetical protein [Terriglobales bacterium]
MRRRPYTRRSLVTAACVLLLACGGYAQTGRANTNTGQAVLHIRVNVIPTTFTPSQPVRVAENEGISYSIPTGVLKQEVKTEESEFHAARPEACATQHCETTLRTTTIVPR